MNVTFPSRAGTANANYRHGLSNHPLKAIREQIISRCLRPQNPQYPSYGGRGISVCDEWRYSLTAFYDWCINNGWEKGLHIDRRDNNGNYEPSNCRFVTNTVNGNNKRNNIIIEFQGRTQTLAQWCKELNLNYSCMLTRIHRKGMRTGEELFLTPHRYAKFKARNIADNKEYLNEDK